MAARLQSKTYIVEHLDPELEAWSALEYSAIARECSQEGARFILSSVPQTLASSLPENVKAAPGLRVELDSVERLYGNIRDRICLLDPRADSDLSPKDGAEFDVFLFGGILGDDPPRDRTAELRQKGFKGRRLGPVQMTTDTAVRVTRLVVQQGMELDKIPYIDFPELKINQHESTEMPFRYVKNESGLPLMPPGMIDLIKRDADKRLDDLL